MRHLSTQHLENGAATSNAPTIATYLKGALFGLTAVSIWAGWRALTRPAVTTKLDAWDIAALRFGIAGCLLAPLAVRRGLALEKRGSSGLALLGDLSGFLPLFVALITAFGLGEGLGVVRKLGLISVGVYLASGGSNSLCRASQQLKFTRPGRRCSLVKPLN